MELTMPTIVISKVFQNSKSEFSLTLTEISWYGKFDRFLSGLERIIQLCKNYLVLYVLYCVQVFIFVLL